MAGRRILFLLACKQHTKMPHDRRRGAWLDMSRFWFDQAVARIKFTARSCAGVLGACMTPEQPETSEGTAAVAGQCRVFMNWSVPGHGPVIRLEVRQRFALRRPDVGWISPLLLCPRGEKMNFLSRLNSSSKDCDGLYHVMTLSENQLSFSIDPAWRGNMPEIGDHCEPGGCSAIADDADSELHLDFELDSSSCSRHLERKDNLHSRLSGAAHIAQHLRNRLRLRHIAYVHQRRLLCAAPVIVRCAMEGGNRCWSLVLSYYVRYGQDSQSIIRACEESPRLVQSNTLKSWNT